MDLKLNHGDRAPLLSFFLFFTLILFSPTTTAICAPRNSTYIYGSPPHHSQKTTSSSPVSVPRKQGPSPQPQPQPPPQPHSPSPENPSPAEKTAPPTTTFPPNDNKPPPPFTRSFLPFPGPALTTPDPALQKICDSTDYPSLCVSSLAPFMVRKPEPFSLLGPAIKATSAHAKVALSAATRLAVAPGASEDLVAALGTCTDSYNDALENLGVAMGALATKDIGTVNSMVSAVVTASEDCEDSFQFEGESPMFDYDDKLRKLASNCLAIASLIK